MVLDNAVWITTSEEIECPVFEKKFSVCGEIKKATLYISSKGVYYAELNGTRIGNFIMAPGWTVYEKRRQFQQYEITELLGQENEIHVTIGMGWERGRILHMRKNETQFIPAALICKIEIEYENGIKEEIITDNSWKYFQGQMIRSDIYDGECYDATHVCGEKKSVIVSDYQKTSLIPQEGELVIEQERLKPISIFTAPNGEQIVDFGQNITGYPEICIKANKGEVVDFSFGEELDKNGNFYNKNYRSAKCEYRYVCRDGKQTYKPLLTFYGFRYIRVNSFPCDIAPENITAIAVYSDIKQTGHIETSNPLLNKLFSNILWGQKDNFLDVPTDCPQRDERLAWTGDAQVFARTACKNFDVEKFYTKWLACLAAEQHKNGFLPKVIPNAFADTDASAGWQDAAVIVPWEVYLAYGNKEILKNQFDSMCKWVDFVTKDTQDKFLWTGRDSHFGDWLGLDAPYGSYIGASRTDLIASAYYAYTTGILVKAGQEIGENVEKYMLLHKNIVEKFKQTFFEFYTQTECAIVLYFGLTDNPERVAAQLNDMIISNGKRLTTGFLGTPYLLHALSDNGYVTTAYDLLLREEFPSWLYSVKCGATTIWEHWDGKNKKGDFWSEDMNSFNHYAYGAVAEWMYSVQGGIIIDEKNPGYKKAIIAPKPDMRLDYFKAELNTRHGKIISEWKISDGKINYRIETPVETTIIINQESLTVGSGKYNF